MAATITFTLTASPYTAITIRANVYPENRPEPPRQKVGVSVGGHIQVALLGDPDDGQRLTFRRLSSADFATLRTYIQSTINYSEKSFTFKDAHATNHVNMHYINGIETFETEPPGTYQGVLVIRKDLGA